MTLTSTHPVLSHLQESDSDSEKRSGLVDQGDTKKGVTPDLPPETSHSPPIKDNLQETKDSAPKQAPSSAEIKPKASPSTLEPSKDDFEALAKRFAALKKR